MSCRNRGTGGSAGDINRERCGILDGILTLNVQGILDAGKRDSASERPRKGCDCEKKGGTGAARF